MFELGFLIAVLLLAVIVVLLSVLIHTVSASADRVTRAVYGVHAECNYPRQHISHFEE